MNPSQIEKSHAAWNRPQSRQPASIPTRISGPELRALNEKFADAEPEEVIAWAAERFPEPTLVMATSLGAEDVLLMDMIARVDRPVRMFTLDTGMLHAETKALLTSLERQLAVSVEVFAPDEASLAALLERQGPAGFYDSVAARKSCCAVRKLEPLARALASASAWIVGLRREQGVTRANTEMFEIDHAHGDILKISPLVGWSEQRVWASIKARGVPYNPLHDQGYPSIGCAPCTRPIAPGEDPRAGRWWWERAESRECGLHTHKSAESGHRSG